MFPFMAAAAAIPAIFQGITGIKQARQANKMQPVRPTYAIPGAVGESVDMARMGANGLMPGYGTAQNNLQGSTSNAVRSAQMAGSGNNVLATIAAAQGNEANAMNNLATQNAQFRFGQRGNLQNSLMNLAGFQDKAWDYNKRLKYDEEAAAKAALTEGSMHNINSAVGGLTSIGMLGMQSQQPTGSIPGFNPEGFYNGYRTS